MWPQNSNIFLKASLRKQSLLEWNFPFDFSQQEIFAWERRGHLAWGVVYCDGGLEVGVAYSGRGRCIGSGRGPGEGVVVMTVVGVVQVRGVACGGAWLELEKLPFSGRPWVFANGPLGAKVVPSVSRQTQG